MEIKAVKDKYKNKLFSVLGDSISTLEGYSRPADAAFYEGYLRLESDVIRPEDTWWGRVIDRLGGRLLVNNSISGSMVSKHRSCTAPTYGCSDARTSDLSENRHAPDVIMVFLGTNDWGCGVKPIPDAAQDGTEGEDISVFSVAYRLMLEKLMLNYPGAEIWCLTLPVGECRSNGNFSFPYCYGGRHIEEYCRVIRQCAEDLACRVIDLYNSPLRHDTLDGFHPNADGMRVLADEVLRQL